MFVGDSISFNHWESLLCLLHASAPDSDVVKKSNGSITSITFKVSEDLVFQTKPIVDFWHRFKT